MGRTILLIDDNELHRYLATFLSQKHGCTVVSAVDRARGVASDGTQLPAMVLPDIHLPSTNGADAARALRRNAALRDVPIRAVTSCAMAGDREKPLEPGCNGYVEKPIDPYTLVAQTAHCLPPEQA